MGWLDDVYTDETIYSTQWGNPIRDRTIHQFASKSERDAVPAAKFADGMACYTATEKVWWLRRDGAWWPITPYRNFAPRTFVNPGTGWVPAAGQRVDEYQWRRNVDVVEFDAVVYVNWGGGDAALALSMPFDPAGFLVKVIGAGYFVNAGGTGATQSGAAAFAGPVTYLGVNYPCLSVINVVVNQPNANGTLYVAGSYRTPSTSDVSPYG